MLLITSVTLPVPRGSSRVDGIFYNQPYQRRGVTYQMIQEVLDILKTQKPYLAPLQVWQAYEQVQVRGKSPIGELVALVSLLRGVTGIDLTMINLIPHSAPSTVTSSDF